MRLDRAAYARALFPPRPPPTPAEAVNALLAMQDLLYLGPLVVLAGAAAGPLSTVVRRALVLGGVSTMVTAGARLALLRTGRPAARGSLA